MKNLVEFAKNGAMVCFPAGTTNSSIPISRIGKLATVLSLVGTVAITTPSTAEARGGGAMMGLIGGMLIGSMLSRGAVASPSYGVPAAAANVPVQTYGTVPVSPYGAYGAQPTYGTGGGAPGTYFCPHGPQHKCFWRGSELEIIDQHQKAAEANMDAALAPRMT